MCVLEALRQRPSLGPKTGVRTDRTVVKDSRGIPPGNSAVRTPQKDPKTSLRFAFQVRWKEGRAMTATKIKQEVTAYDGSKLDQVRVSDVTLEPINWLWPGRIAK